MTVRKKCSYVIKVYAPKKFVNWRHSVQLCFNQLFDQLFPSAGLNVERLDTSFVSKCHES